MPRKTIRKQISFTVSAAQHAAFLVQADRHSMTPSDYMRWLLARDADELGETWPDDLLGAGKYERGAP
jgi:hypothetical protein